MAEPAQQPERLRNETVRRALESRGPATVRTLQRLAGRNPGETDQRIVELSRREQILEQALGAMSRESARLLYVGAKSALEADPVYRVLQDRSPGGDPEPWPAVRDRAERLDRRARGLGAPEAQRWPTMLPGTDAASGHQLADECVRLAEAIRPGWEWTQLMRGIVLKARGRYEEALHCLRPLADKGFDYEVRYWGLRNLLSILMHSEQHADEMTERCSALLKLSPEDPSATYFALELHCLRHDAGSLESASTEIRDRLLREDTVYWMNVLRSRSSVMARLLGLPEETTASWVEELAS